MNQYYTDQITGETKKASEWLEDMGGIECVIGRPLWGAPLEALIVNIMAENGLSKVSGA